MSDETSKVVQTWIPIEPVRLEEYTLVARLGQGGMAEIYLAVHHGLSGFRKLVVIKRLLPHMAERDEVVQMFLDEARLAARLSHPNVVATTKIGTSGGHYFLAMDFIDGLPLNRVLMRAQERAGRLPPEIVAKIVSDALAGLHYAHDASDFDGTPLGVVHRDVSPHNLMVGYDGITKVLDFGIAKASLQEHATRTGLIKGKFAYIAPEQATGDELDRRADVWSAGVVLWEALAGRRLFKGKTEVGTLQEALTKPVPSLLEIHADVPRELAEVCDRALQRDADDRFATALAMKLAIDEWLASRSVRGSHEEVARVVGELFDAEHREQRKLLKALTRFSDVDREVMRDLGTLSTAVALPEGAVSISTSTSASRMTPASVSHVEVRGTPRPSPGPKIAIVAIFLVAAAVGAWFATAPSSSEEASEPIATGPREPVPADPPSGVPSGPTTREPAPEPSPGEPPTDPSATATNGPPTPPRNEPAAVDMQPRVVRRPTTARPRSTSAAPVSTTPTSPAPPRVEPAPEPTEFGFLTLDTNPWSIVSVGGRRLGNTPLVRARLPAGTHVLELSNPELDLRTTYTVVIEANQTYSRRIGIE